MRKVLDFIKAHPAVIGLLTGFGVHPVVIEAVKAIVQVL